MLKHTQTSTSGIKNKFCKFCACKTMLISRIQNVRRNLRLWKYRDVGSTLLFKSYIYKLTTICLVWSIPAVTNSIASLTACVAPRIVFTSSLAFGTDDLWKKSGWQSWKDCLCGQRRSIGVKQATGRTSNTLFSVGTLMSFSLTGLYFVKRKINSRHYA